MANDDPLHAAIKAAHARWSPKMAGRLRPNPKFEPLGEAAKGDEAAAEAHAAWLERSAILEYDGGLSRSEADRKATLDLARSTLVTTGRLPSKTKTTR